MELFLGERRVFAADTRTPQVSVPRTWTSDGQPRQLIAGEYRWYVWPRVSGKRATGAVVQAKLAVTG